MSTTRSLVILETLTSGLGTTVTWMSDDRMQSPLQPPKAQASMKTGNQRIDLQDTTVASRSHPTSARIWHRPDAMSHIWLWISLFVLLVTAIAVDLGVHRHQHRPLTLRAACGWSVAWIALAVGYGALVWWRRGGDRAAEF